MNRSLMTAITPAAATILACALSLGCGESSDKAKSAPDPAGSAEEHADKSSKEKPDLTGESRGDQKRPGKQRMTRLRANNPPMVLVRTAMSRLDLTDEQREEIKSLARVTRPNRDAKQAAKQKLKKDLADAIEKGTIEDSVFAGVYDVSTETNVLLVKERSTRLETLHRLLTPQQRATLVDMVRKDVEQVAAATGSTDAGVRGATSQRRPRRSSRHGRRGPAIAKVIQRMDLTAKQREKFSRAEKKIEAEVAEESSEEGSKPRMLQKNTLALTEVFEKDDFKPGDWNPIENETTRDRDTAIANRARRVQMLVDVLTPVQRGELADLIRSNKKPKRKTLPVVIKKKDG